MFEAASAAGPASAGQALRSMWGWSFEPLIEVPYLQRLRFQQEVAINHACEQLSRVKAERSILDAVFYHFKGLRVVGHEVENALDHDGV